MRTSLAFSPLDLFSIWNGDLDFHWLKFVNRNIIYLLNMPSNNVTLFLSTFSWFYFLGFFTYKQKHTEIKTHKFRIVLWFIASKKKLSARISVSKRQCIKNFSCFFIFLLKYVTWCDFNQEIHNEFLLAFPIDVIYHFYAVCSFLVQKSNKKKPCKPNWRRKTVRQLQPRFLFVYGLSVICMDFVVDFFFHFSLISFFPCAVQRLALVMFDWCLFFTVLLPYTLQSVVTVGSLALNSKKIK